MILPFAGRFTLLVGIPGGSVDGFGIVVIVNSFDRAHSPS
jgi:hypothetical protein